MFAGVGYLLPAVGSTGISLSVYVANHRRHPKSNGIQIEFKRIIGETEVMKSTYAVGKEYPRLGNAILGIFFPGKLSENEEKIGNSTKAQLKQGKPR
jgi:hypothetical protein